VEYLAHVLAWFEERDQRLIEAAHERRTREGAEPSGAFAEAVASPGGSREALEKLAQACARSGGWQEFARFFNGAWCPRRDALDAWLTPDARVADWRAIGGVDADSILQERQLYARVEATRPARVTLEPAHGT
jgi:hypothetical protein